MEDWPAIPEDVIGWFRIVFGEANREVTERLLNVPNIRETSLDDGLIEAFVRVSPPRLLPSGSIVEMAVHNIGGLRRIGKWETADIAVLVFVYGPTGNVLGQKLGLLQSKRLFPTNNDVEDDDPVGFAYGMNQFLRRDPKTARGALYRQFEFTTDSTYSSMNAGDAQIDVISALNDEFGEAVYYLFYNPPIVPTTVSYPVVAYQQVVHPPLGARVYTAGEVHSVLNNLKSGHAPSIGQLEGANPASNWRLETWAADLLLTCKVGQRFGEDRDKIVGRLLERRSGPIGAAIAVSVVLPNEEK